MDWQSLGVGAAAVVGSLSTIVLGIYTGRSKAKVDESTAQRDRERAEEVASRQRIEQIAADNLELRKRVREIDDEYEDRLRLLRKDTQRGWDLASIHFATVGVVVHIINNLLMLLTVAGDDGTINPERLVSAMRNAKFRMEGVALYTRLEEPLDPKPAIAPKGQPA